MCVILPCAMRMVVFIILVMLLPKAVSQRGTELLYSHGGWSVSCLVSGKVFRK